MFTPNFKDVNLEILSHIDDNQLLDICTVNQHVKHLYEMKQLWSLKIHKIYPSFPLTYILTHDETKKLYYKLKHQYFKHLMVWSDYKCYDNMKQWLSGMYNVGYVPYCKTCMSLLVYYHDRCGRREYTCMDCDKMFVVDL